MTFEESCRLSVGYEDRYDVEHRCCASCERPKSREWPWCINHCQHVDRWVNGDGERLKALFSLPVGVALERLSLRAACQ